MRRSIITFFLTIIGVGILLLAFVFSGSYDIGATSPHTRPVRRLIGILTDRSIKHHAAAIQASPLDRADLAEGAAHYDDMCAVCHGEPGSDERSAIAQGLYPRPPRLRRTDDWSDADLFWMIKNGIKMTGMPAFGATHSDEEMWSLVAFVRKKGEMSAQEYHDLVRRGAGAEGAVGAVGAAQPAAAADSSRSGR